MNRNIRNIIIVAFFSVGGGWLGIWLNNVTGNTMPPMESLGALVWLITPALSGILLRAIGGDGWKDSGFALNLIPGWKWYLVAILFYPLAAVLTFGLAELFGTLAVDGFAEKGFSAYISAAGLMLVGSLMKNIFEEFTWRGYLCPRLDAAKVHPMLNHFIVSVLWMSWHLPYYYYYLDRSILSSAITTSVPVFLLTGYIVMFPTAVFFGELRLLSKSVWPVFILHNVINALSMPLLINGFIKLNGPLGFIFSPTNEGIFTSILFGIAGFLLFRYRIRKQASWAECAA